MLNNSISLLTANGNRGATTSTNHNSLGKYGRSGADNNKSSGKANRSFAELYYQTYQSNSINSSNSNNLSGVGSSDNETQSTLGGVKKYDDLAGATSSLCE